MRSSPQHRSAGLQSLENTALCPADPTYTDIESINQAANQKTHPLKHMGFHLCSEDKHPCPAWRLCTSKCLKECRRVEFRLLDLGQCQENFRRRYFPCLGCLLEHLHTVRDNLL